MNNTRVALFVDGDNLSARHAEALLKRAKKLGNCTTARVYLDAAHGNGWLTALGFRAVHSGTGKNASDLLLAIEAMEAVFLRAADRFIIASSDGDFTHLVQRLRERGHYVLGMGEAKAPQALRRVCDAFEVLKGEPVKAECETADNVPLFDRKIRAMIALHSKQGRGIPITQLQVEMHKCHGTKISTYPEKNWHAYLSARPKLYDLDARGPTAHVRFLAEGFR